MTLSTLCHIVYATKGFRNIVVHQYDKVDAEIVVGILKNNLKDFSVYKDAIINFLKLQKPP